LQRRRKLCRGSFRLLYPRRFRGEPRSVPVMMLSDRVKKILDGKGEG
jgi:hypothetical protein